MRPSGPGRILILLGAPGAGKGTCAARLAERFNMPTVSTGDLIRQTLRSEGDLGRRLRSYVEQGALVPDQLVEELLDGRLEQPDCRDGFILDGYPRTLDQANRLERRLLESGGGLACVMSIDASPDLIMARLSSRRTCPTCGAVYNLLSKPPRVEGRCDGCASALVIRGDDQPDTIRRRLRVYEEQTVPLYAFYEERRLLRRVNADRSVEEVVADATAVFLQAMAARPTGSPSEPWPNRRAGSLTDHPPAEKVDPHLRLGKPAPTSGGGSTGGPAELNAFSCEQCGVRSRSAFCDCTVKELRAFDRVRRVQTLPPGSALVSSGAPAGRVWCVYAGRVEERDLDPRSGEPRKRDLASGSLVGHLAFFPGTARSSTATTAEESTLCVFERADFQGVLAAMPDLSAKLLAASRR